MLITLGKEPEGHKIIEYKEVVVGVGKSSSDGENYREAAFKKLAEAANNLGANAVINVHLEINSISGNTVEATAYGNAVILESANESYNPSKKEKINYDKFISSNMDKQNVERGEFVELNGFKFVVCPKCKSKYQANVNEQGQVHVKGFEDVDDKEPGLQIFCVRCGTKFTVPKSI